MKWYNKQFVIQTGKPYNDYYHHPKLENEWFYYVPEHICKEFGILKHFKEPDAYNFIENGTPRNYFGLYNAKGKINFFDYMEAKEKGFYTAENAEQLSIFLETHKDISVVGYTIKHNGAEDEVLTAFQLLYDISETLEYKSFQLTHTFLPEDRLI
jgi:hypothetical protein